MQVQELKIVVGLDIGTTKVCAIVGTKNEHGKIDILGMGKAESLGVIRGEVRNIDKTVKAINEAIEKAKESVSKNPQSKVSRIDISSVHVGIAGQHIKSLQHRNSISRVNTEDEISKEDVERLINDTHNLALPPGDKIIHVLPQEFTVDDIVDVTEPIGMTGVRLSSNFHIITGHVEAIKNINKSVVRANLSVAGLILEPLSSADAVLADEEMEAGVCLVDIGGGTTDVAIFKNGIIRHTAVIPFGGNIITDDITEGCQVLRNQAELLKTKFGSALAEQNKDNEIVTIPSFRGRSPKEVSIKNLALVIQARVEEIFESVLYEIKASQLEKKLNAGIVITGGGSQLKHLTMLVELVTGMDARIGYANEHLGKSHIEEIKSPMYATAVGLVIKGFEGVSFDDKDVKDDDTVNKKEQKTSGGLFKGLVQKYNNWMFNDEDMKDF
ncbi:MAG: cell division protein FtsA [Candidatus Methylacidiphilales bacterium]